MPETIIVDRINEYLRTPGKTVDRRALAKAMWAFKHSARRQFMEDRQSKPGHMYATAVTHPCTRRAAYRYFGFPEDEPLSPRAMFNFAAGDAIEIQVLLCARLAKVDILTPREIIRQRGLPRETKMLAKLGQDGMTCWPDGLVYDGGEPHNVEVKKMSDYAFDAMRESGVLTDEWGYKAQTALEVQAWNDFGVPVKDTVFVGIRGLTGALGEWRIPFDDQLVEKAFERKHAVEKANPGDLPAQAFAPVDEVFKKKLTGKKKLGLQCSYCGHKVTCWESMGWKITTVVKGGGKPVFYLSRPGEQQKAMEVVPADNLPHGPADSEEERNSAW